MGILAYFEKIVKIYSYDPDAQFLLKNRLLIKAKKLFSPPASKKSNKRQAFALRKQHGSHDIYNNIKKKPNVKIRFLFLFIFLNLFIYSTSQ